MVREIVDTEPAVKGDTSGKVLKTAKLATGLEISRADVRADGDKVEIDTRTARIPQAGLTPRWNPVWARLGGPFAFVGIMRRAV